jgi:transposase InsO family protein
VWSYDFVTGQTARGRPFRALTILDEYTREYLAILVARRITADDVLAQLEELFVQRGVPEHIRSDNGPEFTAKAVREWLCRLNVQTLFITPGNPWENGYIESFNARLQLFLSTEIFDTVKEAQIVIELCRVHYNTERPHSSLEYLPPAPETRNPCFRFRQATPKAWVCNFEPGIKMGGRSVRCPALSIGAE